MSRVQDSHKRSVRSVTSSSTSLSMVAELHHSMLPLQHRLFSTTSGSGQAFLKEAEKAVNLWLLRNQRGSRGGSTAQIQ
uniref:Uncharacterized protein n=1 Tax=Triticum urartu TaxID=4572 RepID=A0A8R7JX11_TRIUA